MFSFIEYSSVCLAYGLFCYSMLSQQGLVVMPLWSVVCFISYEVLLLWCDVCPIVCGSLDACALWHYLLSSLVPHAWYVHAACQSIIPITPSSRIYFGYCPCPNKTLFHNDLCTGYIKLPIRVRIAHAGNIKCAGLVNKGLMRAAFSFIVVYYSKSTITQEY